VQTCAKVAALSTNQANLATSDFLTFANLVVDGLASEILAAREEFLLFQDSLAVTAGQQGYRIPYRALNGIIRHMWFEDGTTNRWYLYPLAIESIENYATNEAGTPHGFFVQGNQIMLLPTPNISGTLQMIYPFRPSNLVDVSTTATITAINGSTVTFANMPTNFASGLQYDIIDHLAGNGIVGYDLPAVVSGNTLIFANLPANAAVGNYVALAQQSPVPMLPDEADPLLLEMTVLRIEIIRGNPARIKNSAALVQDKRKGFDQLLANRIISKPHPTGGMSPMLPQGRRPY
jgi:hypothetical protein